MTKKNYVSFAKLVREASYLSKEQKELLAHQMADIFKSDNYAFDRDRFLEACTNNHN